MKYSRYLTIFVAISMLLTVVFVGCGTTKNKPAPASTSDDGAAAAIADIASVDGISEAQAGQIYGHGVKTLDALVGTDPGNLVRWTDSDPAGAVAAIAAAKLEVKKRAGEVRVKAAAERSAAITDLASVEGIDEGNATRIYDAPKNGFKTLEALSQAKPDAIIAAGLAKKRAFARAIAKDAEEKFAAKGRWQADEFGKAAKEAEKAAVEAEEAAQTAAKDAAQKAEKAANLKADAEKARDLAPPLLPPETNPDDPEGN